jgi:hypothetical protein
MGQNRMRLAAGGAPVNKVKQLPVYPVSFSIIHSTSFSEEANV